ncbi:MAG: GNAT family protein [Synergistes sp.]|nr:GNAT family protein [Synergistes sp.]
MRNEDAVYMLEWMHDPAVNSNFRFDFGSMNKEKVLAFIENSFSEETQHFAFVSESDEYLGTISLKHISQVDRNAEYAITTRVCAQGTGAAFNATFNILKYAFEELNLHRVYLNVLEENGRANAFYRKCGFVYEGQFKDHLYLRGEYKNLNWYAMSKQEWTAMYR